MIEECRTAQDIGGRVSSKKQETVVIIGQGYVGLPLANAAAAAGYRVVGYDVSPRTVESLSSGKSHIDDLSDGDVQRMLTEGYVPTSDTALLREAGFFVICVPTPLSDNGGPDLAAVESAAHTIGKELVAPATIILESTTYPGTTDTLVKPIIESYGWEHGTDFLLAFSPERVDPGRTDFTIVNTPKVVGGVTEDATQSASDFYDRFVDEVVPVRGTREAETAKLLENTYRHINIALVNEMAMFCHDLGIDIWEVIRAASTKPFGFQKFTPGPGVGGHCIPIDPNYLSYEVKKQLGYPFHLVDLAQEINAGMPKYVSKRVAAILNEDKKAMNGSTVLLLGVTYKPDIKDQRESPAVPVAQHLRAAGADVVFHDPHVKKWQVNGEVFNRRENLQAAVEEADVVVLLQNHDSYDVATLAVSAKRFFDTRGASTDGPAIKL